MKKFETPLDSEGKPYWIPIVTKNLDYLKGFLHSYILLAQIYGLPLAELNKMISSDRFNDILYDGTRIRDISDKELKEKVQDIVYAPARNLHIENTGKIYEESILTVDCGGCGMHYSFIDENVLPAGNFDCSCCGRRLIHYTNEDDATFYYDGYTKDQINDIVSELHKDFLSTEDDDSGEENK